MCFLEELPQGSTLRGSYGATQDQLQPTVEISIRGAGHYMLEKAAVSRSASFNYVVLQSCQHSICFEAVAVESNPTLKREIFLNLEAGVLPQQSDDKLGTAQ